LATGAILAQTKYKYAMMVFEPNSDFISRKIVNKGVWEEGLNNQLDAVCHNHQCTNVVDLGANLGAFTLYALWRGYRVMSFEMQERVFALLALSVHLNEFDERWTGVNAVLGSELREPVSTKTLRANLGGTYTVIDDDDDRHNSTASHPLTDFLDDTQSHIDFLKVDVEGSEMRVLPSLEPWFSQGLIRYVTLECRNTDVPLIEFMYDRSFECNELGLSVVTSDAFWSHDEAVHFIRNVLTSAQGRQKRYADVFCRHIVVVHEAH